jgi:8-amino-7-oxononanoate synthase
MSVAVSSPWLRKVLQNSAEFQRLQATHPLGDAVIEEIDGRRIRVGRHWLTDFASCNYLGFDLDPEIIDGIPEFLRRWGTHPSWARMIASPILFQQIEAELADLLGVGDVLTLPSLTHIHNNVLPVLGAGGTLLVDNRAHRTIHDGAFIAKGRGATVRRFRHNDVEQVERLLKAAPPGPRLICMDGINSMTGNPPDLPAFADLARRHDALLYIDDGHGFGVVGERSVTESSPYGSRGNSVVRHLGETYDNLILAAGMSKAYSSPLAFVACSTEVKRLIKVAAPSYTFSGPPPVASLATALLGLEVNARRGDELRAILYHRTATLLDHVDKLGAATPNVSGFPIVELLLADPDDADAAGRLLFERGVFVTLAIYPVVPREATGFRIQLTAANTREQVAELVAVLGEINDRFGLRPKHV